MRRHAGAIALAGIAAAVAARAGGPPWQPKQGGAIQVQHAGPALRVICWNIERGVRFDGIRRYLEQENPDLALLQEADWEARRSRGRRIAEELGAWLGLEWAFAAEFRELGQRIQGRDAWHGQATLSRLPLRSARVLRFRRQSTSWRPKPWLPQWSVFQPREGGRIALITQHELPGATLIAYNVHLESREEEALRLDQVREVLEDAAGQPPDSVIVLAGDFNTKTGSASPVIREVLASGFRVAAGGQVTTRRGQALDWIFVRGRVRASGARVRSEIRSSDHYPVEVRLELEKSAAAHVP